MLFQNGEFFALVIQLLISWDEGCSVGKRIILARGILIMFSLVMAIVAFQNCSQTPFTAIRKISSESSDNSSVNLLQNKHVSALSHCPLITPVMATRTFESFGAKGDGNTDDTKAIQTAFNSGVTYLSGEGRTYLVKGSLRITGHISISDATFQQVHLASADPYTSEFLKSHSTRTLFVRAQNPGGPLLKTNFVRVKVDRGNIESQGSFSDAAAMYIDAAEPCLENVEITGNGRGHGIFIYGSQNVRLIRPYIHDMTWAPYQIPGSSNEELLNWEIVSQRWNKGRVYYWHPGDRGYYNCDSPATKDKVELSCRIQEQIVGLTIINSTNVEVYGAQIRDLNARFQNGRLFPYETDGIDVGGSKNVLFANNPWTGERTEISYTWEGFDITGSPSEGVTIEHAFVHDIHSFCYKFANGPHVATVMDSRASYCGLAGFVVGGPSAAYPNAPAQDIWFEGVVASAAGLGPRMDRSSGGASYPLWAGQEVVAGFSMLNGSSGPAQGVNIVNARVDGLDEQGQRRYLDYAFYTSEQGPRQNGLADISTSDDTNNFKSGEINHGTVQTPIGWAELDIVHRQIMGCEIANRYRRFLFRAMLDAGMMWSRDRVIADIVDFQRRGIYTYCAEPPVPRSVPGISSTIGFEETDYDSWMKNGIRIENNARTDIYGATTVDRLWADLPGDIHDVVRPFSFGNSWHRLYTFSAMVRRGTSSKVMLRDQVADWLVVFDLNGSGSMIRIEQDIGQPIQSANVTRVIDDWYQVSVRFEAITQNALFAVRIEDPGAGKYLDLGESQLQGYK